MIPLPQWMTPEHVMAWEDYVSQRARDKKAMTHRSMVGRIARLQALKDAGHDPLQCLDEAINGHWLDFYAPKDKPIERKACSQADKTRAMLDEMSARGSPIPDNVRQLARRLRA